MKTLDIEPTTICNLKCPFCFGPKTTSNKTEININTWKSVIIKFMNHGVKNIVVSGGEPTLYKNINELLRFIKDLNLNIILSTNGRFTKKIFELADVCDWISLPIDAVTKNISHIMRTDKYPASKILETAKSLKKYNPKIKIKIGTVATKKNIDEIYKIGCLLESNSNILDTWKIYQYTPRRKFKENKIANELPDESYNKIVKLISTRFSEKIKIVSSSNLSRKNAYCFIYHNGDINLVNVGNDFNDLYVGSALELENINMEMILSILNHNHKSNFESTY